MPLCANLFRLGSSIQKHTVSSGAAPVGPLTIKKKTFRQHFLTFIKRKIFLKIKSVLKLSETYAQKILLKSEKKKLYNQQIIQIYFLSQTFFFCLKIV